MGGGQADRRGWTPGPQNIRRCGPPPSGSGTRLLAARRRTSFGRRTFHGTETTGLGLRRPLPARTRRDWVSDTSWMMLADWPRCRPTAHVWPPQVMRRQSDLAGQQQCGAPSCSWSAVGCAGMRSGRGSSPGAVLQSVRMHPACIGCGSQHRWTLGLWYRVHQPGR